MSSDQVVAAVSASSVGELSWLDDTGVPQVRGVVPLLRQGRAVVAFTYADEQVARQAARSNGVVLTLTEPRSTGRAFRPVAVAGRPRLVEDPTGEVFVADLLEQELRRFPPARLFADSPLLMREHWWYLPRLVVELDEAALEPLPARAEPRDHVLVVADRGEPRVRVAGVLSQTGRAYELGVGGAAPPAGAAVLFGQDASFPDLDHWSQWRYRGHWDGGSCLSASEAPARPGLGRAPGLLQRWRRQRDLQRRCAAAIPRR